MNWTSKCKNTQYISRYFTLPMATFPFLYLPLLILSLILRISLNPSSVKWVFYVLFMLFYKNLENQEF